MAANIVMVSSLELQFTSWWYQRHMLYLRNLISVFSLHSGRKYCPLIPIFSPSWVCGTCALDARFDYLGPPSPMTNNNKMLECWSLLAVMVEWCGVADGLIWLQPAAAELGPGTGGLVERIHLGGTQPLICTILHPLACGCITDVYLLYRILFTPHNFDCQILVKSIKETKVSFGHFYFHCVGAHERTIKIKHNTPLVKMKEL